LSPSVSWFPSSFVNRAKLRKDSADMHWRSSDHAADDVSALRKETKKKKVLRCMAIPC
jgi:hypothetical protein